MHSLLAKGEACSDDQLESRILGGGVPGGIASETLEAIGEVVLVATGPCADPVTGLPGCAVATTSAAGIRLQLRGAALEAARTARKVMRAALGEGAIPVPRPHIRPHHKPPAAAAAAAS
ncbi:unnamed protein product [Cuscuta epithymum]|uniref:Uncharacterized protein n=1 Tax=Cuscuta epithymum TaxID=186058 RepID=A0AAV0DTY0_9ASTE|nr:unnamed protein product [Cuscuta epithymum]